MPILSSRMRLRTRPGILPPVLACAAFLVLAGCGKKRTLVWQAERKARIGGEFIRLYDDGNAEYGYGVVSEKLKAEGAYRRSRDTLYFLDGSFKAHFPAGYLLVREGVVFMESGLHFLETPPPQAP